MKPIKVSAVQRPATTTEPAEQCSGVSGAAGDWLTPARFAVVLALLIVAAFPQVVFGLQAFVVRDFGFFAYPLAQFQKECFWHGQLPFWNPYNNCGIPFLAQWNTMPLYPPALIYLLLPLSWSLSFFCLLHLFWAGLGMYFLAHRWTGNRLAASVAGLVFAFNGMSINLLMWPSHIATFSWVAWVVLTVERAWREGGRKVVVAAICGALQMLAGGPETILLTWLLLTAIWGMQLAQRLWAARAPERRAPALHSRADMELCAPSVMLWRFPLIVLLVAAIAASQILPFLDLAAHSQREQGYADTRWSMPGWGWANFLVPMAFGQVWSMGVFFQHQQAWTSSYYLGVGALILAVVTVRSPRMNLLTVAAGLALALSLGQQSIVYRWIHHVLPQLSLMTYPVKFLIVVTFAVPLLAAFAIARLQERNKPDIQVLTKRLLLLSGLLLGLIVAIVVWARGWPFPNDNFPDTLWNGVGRAGFLVVAAVLVWMLQWLARSPLGAVSPAKTSGPVREQIGRFIPFLLLLVLWLDIWTHEPPQNPTVSPTIYAPNLARIKLDMRPQPSPGESRAMLSPSAAAKFREFIVSSPENNFIVKRLGYFADCNVLDHVPKVDGFFSLYPRECGELSSVLYGSTNASFSHLADFMSVSQITAPGEFFKWKPRETFLPLVTVGQKPFYFDNNELLFAVFSTNFDARTMVCLPKESRPSVTVTNQTRARIISSHFANLTAEVDVDAAEASLLVISQTFYHGWRAYVDGNPSSLLRANYAFQALQVPAGRHQVHLAYRDHAFYAGAVASALGLLACLIGWFANRAKTS